MPKKCNDKQTRNPRTNRCVAITSPVGKLLTAPSECPSKTHIRNPRTDRCVLLDGRLGRQIEYMKVAELRDMCRKLGIPHSGKNKKWLQRNCKRRIKEQAIKQLDVPEVPDISKKPIKFELPPLKATATVEQVTIPAKPIAIPVKTGKATATVKPITIPAKPVAIPVQPVFAPTTRGYALPAQGVSGGRCKPIIPKIDIRRNTKQKRPTNGKWHTLDVAANTVLAHGTSQLIHDSHVPKGPYGNLDMAWTYAKRSRRQIGKIITVQTTKPLKLLDLSSVKNFKKLSSMKTKDIVIRRLLNQIYSISRNHMCRVPLGIEKDNLITNWLCANGFDGWGIQNIKHCQTHKDLRDFIVICEPDKFAKRYPLEVIAFGPRIPKILHDYLRDGQEVLVTTWDGIAIDRQDIDNNRIDIGPNQIRNPTNFNKGLMPTKSKNREGSDRWIFDAKYRCV